MKDSLEHLTDAQFRRLTGLKRPVFTKMLQVLHAAGKHKQGGNRHSLRLEKRLLMALEY